MSTYIQGSTYMRDVNYNETTSYILAILNNMNSYNNNKIVNNTLDNHLRTNEE